MSDPGAAPWREEGTSTASGLGLAAMAANVLSLGFVVVVARSLGPDEYGALAALISAFLVVGIGGSALQITVAREVSQEEAAGSAAIGAQIARWTRAILLLAVGTAALGTLARGQIAQLIGVDDFGWAAVLVIPTGVVWLLLSVLRGALQGVGRYTIVGLSIIGEAGARVVVGGVLVAIGLGVSGAFLASGVSMVLMSIYAYWGLRDLARSTEGERIAREPRWRLRALALRTWPALVALSLFALLQNTDVIMVKRMATESAAGAYAADAVAAKVIIWVALGLGLYVVPEAARIGGFRAARGVFARAAVLVSAAGIAMVAAYALIGTQLIEVAFGDEFANEPAVLTTLGAAMTCLSVVYLGSQFMLALGKRSFLALFALAAAAQIAWLSQVADDPAHAAVALLVIQGVLLVLFALLMWWLAWTERDTVTGPVDTLPE